MEDLALTYTKSKDDTISNKEGEACEEGHKTGGRARDDKSHIVDNEAVGPGHIRHHPAEDTPNGITHAEY